MSSERPSHGRLSLLLALVVTFWSFNYVVGKIALRQFPPMLLVSLRMGIAAALLLPVFAWSPAPKRSIWSWRELRVLIPLGLGGVAGNQFLFVLGLARTSVAHAAIVVALSPILVLTMAAGIGQESLSPRKLLGMVLAFSGIIVLQFGRVSGSRATLSGDLYVLLGAISFAAFNVFGKAVSKRHGGIAVNTVAYVSAGLVLTPLLVWQGRQFQFSAVTSVGWLSVFYMAAVASVISYLMYYYALSYLPASRVSGLSYLQPVLATLMAIPILREPVGPGLLLGGSLALAGVYVTERS